MWWILTMWWIGWKTHHWRHWSMILSSVTDFFIHHWSCKIPKLTTIPPNSPKNWSKLTATHHIHNINQWKCLLCRHICFLHEPLQCVIQAWINALNTLHHPQLRNWNNNLLIYQSIWMPFHRTIIHSTNIHIHWIWELTRLHWRLSRISKQLVESSKLYTIPLSMQLYSHETLMNRWESTV